jgi:capsid protein
MYKLYQRFVVDHFMRPVFEKWLEMSISSGAIIMDPDVNIPLPMSKYEKFAADTIFIGRSFQWVDPQKEMNASISGMQAGLVTYQDVQSNYGRDVEELYEQHEREQKLAEQYGIKTAFQPFGIKLPIEPVIKGGSDGDSE